MSLIEAKNLEKTYYTDGIATPVLKGVSFSIEPGDFVAIMGPSGSGKSTLLHILGFLSRHSAGEYRFEGKTFDDYSKSEIAHARNKKMGFVFQSFNLLARTTVIDNVKLPLLYSDVPENEWNDMALKLIKTVGLSHRISHLSSQLSGGEQQRVAIARAFVNNPPVIFADEPTGNLDTATGIKIMDILKTFNEKLGHTIILITHELDIAQGTKRIIKLVDGKIASDTKVNHNL
ncbi:ABC transporter ATP-binding protein [Patescibacteria group bacterium]|nr:ABC transporter ATP-binding protein [Patescibacteria group bacterium]MBU4512948.1 ABC transporter ATP-binding protein [Patescibacteria group bacterium]MCG2692985.1 ABC transporter ATP-binding protein [Candidatus Parcubacteria bacterium]